jgi:hypothetical protein
LEVKVPKACEVACVKKLKATEKQAFVRAIDDDYRVHWMVDNLPVGSYVLSTDGEQYFTRGYPVGFTTGTGEKTMKHYLYNHIRIIIQYHDDVDYEILGFDDNPTTKIVGFRVEPYSIHHTSSVEDIKKGKLRDYHGPIFWNYGCIPQTWEDPNVVHPEVKCKGDNDPLDVVEIGSAAIASGSVVKVCAYARFHIEII